jgi:hypothetical protein
MLSGRGAELLVLKNTIVGLGMHSFRKTAAIILRAHGSPELKTDVAQEETRSMTTKERGRKAIEFVLGYEKDQEREPEDVSANKNHSGYDVVLVQREMEKRRSPLV